MIYDNPQRVSSFKRLRWRFSKGWPERALFHMLSEKWCGSDNVPLRSRSVKIERKDDVTVAMFLNDSFDIGLGYPDGWDVIYRRETFHKVIFWYLRQWIFGEWLGLRRKLWYVLLDRRVRRTKRLSLSKK